MPRTKKWLSGVLFAIYALAVISSLLVQSNLLSESARLSLVSLLDVFHVSARLSSRSSFSNIAQVYYAFCVYLVPFFFVLSMLWFWAPTLPSYKERIIGLSRIKFFLVGTIVSALGVLGLSVFQGQDTRLFPIGSSFWTLLVFGWVPYIGSALAVSLGISGIYRSIRR